MQSYKMGRADAAHFEPDARRSGATRGRVIDCQATPREADLTRRFPAGTLGRHAAVALTTGCEALPTMYRRCP